MYYMGIPMTSMYRDGDYYYYCFFCNKKIFASEAILLSKETGFGGMRVCSDHNIEVDYFLVPYKVNPEKTVPFSRNPLDDYTTPYAAFNPETGNPFVSRDFVPPAPPVYPSNTWSEVTTTLWESWSGEWENKTS